MQREPVRRAVMLLGWSGSKLRHVRKHEGCWPSGTAVFAENVTIEDTFARSGRAALREKARRLVAEAKATKAPRLYAHIFSNGGSMLLLEVLSELEPLRLDGVVYDSAPSAEGTIRPIAGPVIAYLSGGTLRAFLYCARTSRAGPGCSLHMSRSSPRLTPSRSTTSVPARMTASLVVVRNWSSSAGAP